MRVLLPAVVVHVHEQGVVQEAAAFDEVHQLAHAVVPPSDVGVVQLGGFAQRFVFVELGVGVGSVERRVGQLRREPEEERRLLAAVDEVVNRLHGFAQQVVAGAAHHLQEEPLPAERRHVPAGAHPFREVAVLVAVLPPLAALPARVAGRGQERRQRVERTHGGGHLHYVPLALLARVQRGVARILPLPAFHDAPLAQHILHRVQPGDGGTQRRPAVGRRDVPQGERVAARGQGVHGGRDHVAVAHEAEVGIAVVVADQQHDVGRLFARGREAGDERQRRQCQAFQSAHE